MPQRVVTRLPLTELWDDSGPLPFTRGRPVGRAELADLLRVGPVRFVVADCGSPLRWVPADDRYRFWKDEVKPRLVEADVAEGRFRLEDFPGERCYVATLWGEGEASPVVVLEARH